MISRTLILLVAFLIFDCATVPVSGRRQFSLVPNSQLLPMAEDQYRQMMSESKLSNNQQQVQMVKRVGTRIQKAVEEYMAANNAADQLAGFTWEFNLIEEDIINAWCMPGGKVAFYTGILPVCKDEQGVAVVMGHEVAHAVANHGRERMSQGLVQHFGMSTISGAMGQDPSLAQNVLLQSVGVTTQLGILKFTRTHESEADELGLIFMAMAGYHPKAAPEFWQRMATVGGGGAPPEFLSTHPSHDRRIADLNALIPKAMEYYKEAK